MITAKGVYTASCPKCGSPTLIHVLDSDGSISTKNCSGCEAKFKGIDKGEQRNSFVAILKEDKKSDKKSSEDKGFSFKRSKKSFEKKEDKKSDKKPSENKSSIVDLKTGEKPYEKKEESKKTGKKLFKW